MPRVVYSDNGTNFVGASKELRDSVATLQPDIIGEAAKLGLQWKFIPPGAPHMGGAWERLVRSIKVALDATLNERHPKEEELHTLLLEAEHIVNSRPLTHLAEDWQEEALTPNHFLIGRSCGATRLGNFCDDELVGRHTWKTTQRLADHFWRRWVREYLPTLLPRKISGRTSATELRVGDIVLIVDSSLPRCTWPRGKVAAVYPGPDGRTRIVDVATRGGVLRRPATRLVVLVEAPGESPNREDGAAHEGETVGDEDPVVE
uniref:Integrase catalytic domain-containing protein n=1 Tax=Heliothis virescens TaxID=7102 RepID=A0A2A4IU87_HELVI